MKTPRLVKCALLGLGLSFAALTAQAACPAGLPPGVTCGGGDLSLATAGAYKLDASHAAVIARVSHIGYSYSVFRFDKVEGDLVWDPAKIAESKLTATVQVASIATNVPGFAGDISTKFLNAPAFPTATFVSTAFRPTDATHGKVDGQFTLMGKTAPVTFDVDLVGAGKGFGKPRLGVSARGTIKPQDFGLPAMLADPIDLVIDVEFEKAG